MRNLLFLLVLLGVGYYFYQDRFSGSSVGGLGEIAPVVEAKHSSHSFDTVTSLLQQDMQNIPSSLDGNGPKPTHAYDVKRQLRPHLSEHQEYQTLTRVCDLIIGADAERSALQQTSHAEEARTAYHSPLESTSPQKHAALPDPAIQQNAIRQRVEGTWNARRTQTAGEVEQLLGTLKGRTI